MIKQLRVLVLLLIVAVASTFGVRAEESAPTVAVIANPDNPVLRDLAKDVEADAPKRRLKVRIIEVRASQAIEGAFAEARRQVQEALVFSDQITMANQQRIVALAAKHRLPVLYSIHDFVQAGGLMAYGPDLAVMWRRAAEYVDKILKGAKPADLPVEQPNQFVLAVNLKTAKALGLTFPESILIRADEVIR